MNIINELKKSIIEPLVLKEKQKAFLCLKTVVEMLPTIKANIKEYDSMDQDETKLSPAQIEKMTKDMNAFRQVYDEISNILFNAKKIYLPTIFDDRNFKDNMYWLAAAIEDLEEKGFKFLGENEHYKFFEDNGKVSPMIIETLESFDYVNAANKEETAKAVRGLTLFEIKENVALRKSYAIEKGDVETVKQYEEIEKKIVSLELAQLKEEEMQEKKPKSYNNQIDDNGVIRSGKTIVKVSQSALELLNKNPKLFWKDCEEIAPSAFEGLDFSGVKVNYAYSQNGKQYGKHSAMTHAGFYPNAQIKIPPTVKVIGMNAFANCKGLESVHIAMGEVQKHAFADCKDLEAVFMSLNQINFGSSVFAGTNLRSFTSNFRRAVGGYQQESRVFATKEFAEQIASHKPYQGFNEISEMPAEFIVSKTAEKPKAKAGDSLSFITENKGMSAGKGMSSRQKGN